MRSAQSAESLRTLLLAVYSRRTAKRIAHRASRTARIPHGAPFRNYVHGRALYLNRKVHELR